MGKAEKCNEAYWLLFRFYWDVVSHWEQALPQVPCAAYQNGQTVKDLVPGGQVLHIYGAWGQKTK